MGAAIASSFHIVVGISLAYSAILLPQLKKEQEDKVENYVDLAPGDGSWIGNMFKNNIFYFNSSFLFFL